MKKIGSFFFSLFLFTLGPEAFAAVFTDEIGRQVEVLVPPRRIISVAPSVTEILFSLGLGERVVGVSSHCNYPPEARSKEKVGGYITPSLEKIVALHPDLVIQTADGDLKTFVERLSGLGIPVYIANPRSVAEVLESILKIGGVTSSLPHAQRLASSMREKMQAVQQKVQGRPQPRVLHAMSVDPLISSGKETFVHDLMVLAGGKNVAENARGKHPQLSMEEVMARDPEVILLSAMLSSDSLSGAKEVVAALAGHIRGPFRTDFCRRCGSHPAPFPPDREGPGGNRLGFAPRDFQKVSRVKIRDRGFSLSVP